MWGTLTSSDSQLPHPWHADQHGHLVRNIHVILLFKAIVPRLIVNVWKEILPHPPRQSDSVGYL